MRTNLRSPEAPMQASAGCIDPTARLCGRSMMVYGVCAHSCLSIANWKEEQTDEDAKNDSLTTGYSVVDPLLPAGTVLPPNGHFRTNCSIAVCEQGTVAQLVQLFQGLLICSAAAKPAPSTDK